jgi:hypothetical protein
MRAFAGFILVKSRTKEVLINVAQIESIRETDYDPNICEIHMIGDGEEQWFLARHTLQDLVLLIDEISNVYIAGVNMTPRGVVLLEIESIAAKETT